MRSVTACALNLPNTTQTLTGTMHSVSICALHKTNTATVHSVTICAPSRNTTPRSKYRAVPWACTVKAEHVQHGSRQCSQCCCAPTASVPLAKQDLSVCMHSTVCTCNAARRLRSGHTGSQEPVDGFPSQPKAGPRLGWAVLFPATETTLSC